MAYVSKSLLVLLWPNYFVFCLRWRLCYCATSINIAINTRVWPCMASPPIAQLYVDRQYNQFRVNQGHTVMPGNLTIKTGHVVLSRLARKERTSARENTPSRCGWGRCKAAKLLPNTLWLGCFPCLTSLVTLDCSYDWLPGMDGQSHLFMRKWHASGWICWGLPSCSRGIIRF